MTRTFAEDTQTMTFYIYLALFFIVAGIVLVPLFLCRKSSIFYIPIWSIYAVGVVAIVLDVVWKIISFERPENPQDGTPMSPIGDVTEAHIITAIVFLLAILIGLYTFTVGLPWAFKNWPPDRKRKGADKMLR